jgi:hypothetical protein
MLPELVLSTAMQENEEKQMVLWVEYELSVVEEERGRRVNKTRRGPTGLGHSVGFNRDCSRGKGQVKDDGKGRQAYLLRYCWKPASAVAVLLLGAKGWEVVDSEARSSGEVDAPADGCCRGMRSRQRGNR